MDVVVFGSAIIDLICYAPRIPKAGETLHGSKFASGYGGKGANQCVSAAKLGAKTALIAKVGNDTWGENYIDNLKKENVNVTFVEKISDTTGIAQITVSDSGENQIVIIPGANNQLSVEDVKKASNIFTAAKVLICQLETPIEATVEALRQFNGISILNAAPALENTPQELLKLSTIFCVNETEAGLMTKQDVETIRDAKSAIEKLKEMGGNTIIITMGKKGAVFSYKNDKKIIHVATNEIEKVADTTGAGDAFIGSLAFCIAKYPNVLLHQQIGAACEIATISVQKPGTQSSFPSIDDLDEDFFNFNTKCYEFYDLT